MKTGKPAVGFARFSFFDKLLLKLIKRLKAKNTEKLVP